MIEVELGHLHLARRCMKAFFFSKQHTCWLYPGWLLFKLCEFTALQSSYKNSILIDSWWSLSGFVGECKLQLLCVSLKMLKCFVLSKGALQFLVICNVSDCQVSVRLDQWHCNLHTLFGRHGCHLWCDYNKSSGDAIVVLCRMDTTFVWPIQKHWCTFVHMEIGKDNYCAKGFEHCHVQFQEYQYLLSIFGIHHAMQKDTHLNLQTHSSISLAVTPKYYMKWRTVHHRHNYNYLHPIKPWWVLYGTVLFTAIYR